LTRVLSPEHLEFLQSSRVARLGTSSKNGPAYIVPIVFANTENRIYFVIDHKTKSGKELKRLSNIRETGKGTLLVDKYSENWDELFYLLLFCRAKVIEGPGGVREKKLAEKILKEKYPQYSTGQFFPENLQEAVFVRLDPERAIFWQNLH